jgi:hypothetical protein
VALMLVVGEADKEDEGARNRVIGERGSCGGDREPGAWSACGYEGREIERETRDR